MAVTDPRYLWEVALTAATNSATQTPLNFRFDEGGGELTAGLTAGNYFIRGGGNPGTDLLAAIQTAMNAAGANTYVVTRSTTGYVTIATNPPAAFTLRWLTGAAPLFDGTVLGFDTAANDGPGTTFTSDYQHRFGWYPEKLLVDGYRFFNTATAGSARSLGNQQYTQQWATDRRGVHRIDYVPYTKIRYHDYDATVVGTALQIYQALSSGTQTTWEGFYEAMRRGAMFEMHRDASTVSNLLQAVLDPDKREAFEDLEAVASLLLERGERYRVEIPYRVFTA